MTVTASPERTIRGLVTVVLPARNEEAGIASTIRSIPVATLRAIGLDTEIVVLDGRSHDRTAEIARALGGIVIPDREPGKGAALRNAVPQFRGEYVVMLDADGTYAPDAIPRVLGPILRGDIDVVIGHRRRTKGSMSTSHFVGNKALSLFATFLFGRTCQDVCTGMWGFRASTLRAMPLQSKGFGLEAELFGWATRLRARATHVRVDYLPRRGETKISFGHDGLRIVRRLMHTRFGPIPVKEEGAATATTTTSTGEVQA
jgi:dolichol-phosphate mannosyltransferase